ncbi:hypothetical protein OIU77_018068 [Salix suchowensis]|uniref:Uncharacterized protein n=2 Tax=Salix TaxID=40685 RepID=A0A9Q0X6N8_9ROSI|nr:hypothetical protein OIU77_018068 [Salix suchowensis]KAJ6316875.1 hypothetical protein OIU78_020041 [Salix suchowensis]KAJ6778943.1 hypothetical protein OIU74_002681 [Salix koriyanagi]
MAENSIEKPSKIQDSSRDPPSLATSSSSSSQEEKPETIRESKRRKSCPAALDKIAEFTPSNFSFTFDTRFSTSSQEFTPKFGSFNLVSSTRERPDDHTALCFHQSSENKDGGHRDDKQQVGGACEERVVNISTLRRAVDGIREKKKQ